MVKKKQETGVMVCKYGKRGENTWWELGLKNDNTVKMTVMPITCVKPFPIDKVLSYINLLILEGRSYFAFTGEEPEACKG